MNTLFNKMQPCISVLTHITSDVSQPSLYLTAKNGQKYLIGRIGEGFQRVFGEHNARTAKLSGVFLTGGNHWPSVSGLPGMLLSFIERDIAVAALHTGPGAPHARCAEMIESWRTFTYHQPLSIRPTSAAYADDNVEIAPITLGAGASGSTSFVLQMKPTRGTFMVEKALALGVPRGELFGRLSEGHSVTLPGSGRVVAPHEVVGPSPKPARVLVLDLPAAEHVAAAADAAPQLLRPFACTQATGFETRAVYCFFGGDVDLAGAGVAALLARLAPAEHTRVFVSHPATSPNFISLKTFAEFQARFRAEFPAHFSLQYARPAHAELPPSLLRATAGTGGGSNVGGRVRVLRQQHVLSIAPRASDAAGGAAPAKKKKRAKIEEEYEPPASPSDTATQGWAFVPCAQLAEPEVVTLGTGASAPSKYRNVAGTLVRAETGAYLFDCGEATGNNMARVFGEAGRLAVVRELRLLYISHMHADHHLGGQQIVRLRLQVAQAAQAAQSGADGEPPAESPAEPLPPLVVAAPKQFHDFLQTWARIDGFEQALAAGVRLVDLNAVCKGNRYAAPEPADAAAIADVAAACGFELTTCRALHCPFSYNGSVTTPADSRGRQYKLSYSGDTRPNRYFAQHVGLGSDLLIHEATHANELAKEAHQKGHSTIGQALEIARLMEARNTILTHISQRYPRLPTLDADDAGGAPEDRFACFAFDAMHTKLSEIQGIQRMVPRMSELFDSLEPASDSASEL